MRAISYKNAKECSVLTHLCCYVEDDPVERRRISLVQSL